MLKRIVKIGLLTLLTINSFTTTATEAPSFFSDVNEGNRNFIAINALKEKGIIQGYDDGSFRGSQNVNRAEALKMLTLAGGVISEDEVKHTAIDPEEMIFTDVKGGAWYAPYIKIAKEKGIIQGYEDGSFKPEQEVNLAEVLKIYLGALDKPENNDFHDPAEAPFADVPTDIWFGRYAQYAKDHNLVYIDIDNTIKPDQILNRAYLAEIIYRTIMLSEGYNYGKATYYGAAVQGHGTSSGEIFDLNLFTAAHKTLPFGTMVEVTDLSNGRSVVVKINDRGPYGPGRVLDLSSSSFKELAPLSRGVINIQYKIEETSDND